MSDAQEDRAGEWYERAFDELYAEVYAHRDDGEARLLIRTLEVRLGLVGLVGLGGPVLDLACGPGRLLRALTEIDVPALGLDLSLPLLRRARAALSDSRVALLRADMRWLPLRSRSLPWVLSLFTSFGYFEQVEEDLGVLFEISRVLAPGGVLVLDFLNDDHVRKTLLPETWREIPGRMVRENRWIDPLGPFLRKKISIADPSKEMPPLTYEERVRLYTPPQLNDLVHQTGLKPLAAWGDYEGHDFEGATSPRCIVVARKEGDG